jgi:hypothetical protein
MEARMASIFRNTLPDWDAKLPPRSYKYDPFPSHEPAGRGDPRDESDLAAARPFPPIKVQSPRDRANARIGCALMVGSALIVVMMIVQFLRSHALGVL